MALHTVIIKRKKSFELLGQKRCAELDKLYVPRTKSGRFVFIKNHKTSETVSGRLSGSDPNSPSGLTGIICLPLDAAYSISFLTQSSSLTHLSRERLDRMNMNTGASSMAFMILSSKTPSLSSSKSRKAEKPCASRWDLMVRAISLPPSRR